MRRLLLILLILAILSAAGIAGLHYVMERVLPAKVQEWAASASQTLGRRITIGRVRVHLWRGLVLEQVSIGEDRRYGETPFLTIDQVAGKVLFLPLLKNRQFVIPTLRITRPQVRLLQDTEGIWNFQSLQRSKARPSGTAGRLPLLIPRLVVENGGVEISSQKQHPPLHIQFQDLNLEAHLSLPAKIRWSLSTQLDTTPPAPAIAIRSNGSYDLRSRKIFSKEQSSIPLKGALSILPSRWVRPVESLEGTAVLELTLAGNPETGPCAVEGSVKGEGLSWKVHLPRDQVFQGSGNLRLDFQGLIPSLKGTEPWKHVSGGLALDRVTVGPFPSIGELKDMTGLIRFNPTGLQMEGLTAALPSGGLLTMSGSLANDEKKTLLLRANTASLPLSQLSLASPKIQGFAEAMKASGRVAVEANVEGALRPTLSFHPTVLATLKEGSLDLPRAGPVREVTGLIRWQPDLLTVTDLTGRFRDHPFRAEGSLANFARPEIDARASWGHFFSEMRLSIDGNRMEIHEFSGRYGAGTLRIFGEVAGLNSKGAATEMTGNLYGEAAFRVEELAAILPQPPTWLRNPPLRGQMATRWILKGPLAQPTQWQFSLKGSSPLLTYQEIPLEQLTLEVEHHEGLLTLSSAKAALAGGTVRITGSLAYQQPRQPWSGTLAVKNVELAALANQLKWKTQNLSGLLSVDWEGEGHGALPANIQGKGTVQVTGGRILEFPLLGPLADLLKAPTLKTIAFQEAEGPFTLSEGALRTESFQVRSPQATLMILGSGGFLKGTDSPINWRILPTFSSELLPEEARSKVGRAIAQGTTYLMGEIRITGTWRNPKRTFVSKPVTQILNEQLFNLQDVLKDLF
ncbi:MAG: AsmA family protein [Candidatus Omnitrophica bacterium]|nr:AsmA family protein [Candidatus Omnitrophota bacterium]